MYSQRCRYFCHGEKVLATETAEAVLKVVFATHVIDDEVGELVGDPGTKAPGIEDVGHLTVGMIVKEAIDSGNHRGVDLLQLPGIARDGKTNGAGGAPSEADMDHDLLRSQQCHVFQEQADHALALPMRGRRVAPEAREACGQGQDLCSLLLIR